MGFWSTLGKIGLSVAPYVAAPFTGGASLALKPLTDKAVSSWNQKDANKRMEQGLGTSKFDRFLDMGNSIAGMASGSGAFGKTLAGAGGNTSYINRAVGDVAKSGSNTGWQSKLGDILGGMGGNNGSIISDDPRNGGITGNMGRGGYGGYGGTPPYVSTGNSGGGWAGQIGDILDRFRNSGNGGSSGGGNNGSSQGAPSYQMSQGGGGSRFGRQMRRELGPVMGQQNQNFPNLAESLGAGRMEAIRNQPWRGGYDVNTVGPDDEEGNPTTVTSQMPSIYPTGRRRGSRFSYASQ